MPDPGNEVAKKRKQRQAAADLQTGREATLLSQDSGDTLGGGY